MFCQTEENEDRFKGLPEEAQGREIAAVCQWLEEHGAVSAARLLPPATATTVRFRTGGSLLIEDGPFAGGDEGIVGFALLDVEDSDRALRIAKTWPAGGVLELRPVLEPPALDVAIRLAIK
ncbi:MAG: YciI family protein [Chloroflexota bacterium]